jgi:hypothetical protein
MLDEASGAFQYGDQHRVNQHSVPHPADTPQVPDRIPDYFPERVSDRAADLDDEDPLDLQRRLEHAALAAGELQAALLDLETELLRLQQIVRRASPAMMQLMQAATEVRAAGLADR